SLFSLSFSKHLPLSLSLSLSSLFLPRPPTPAITRTLPLKKPNPDRLLSPPPDVTHLRLFRFRQSPTPTPTPTKRGGGGASQLPNLLLLFQRHIDTNADIIVSYVPMDDSHASDYGLLKIDNKGRIIQSAEKPKGPYLKAMQVDTALLGLSVQDAVKFPYIASMGVYVFRNDVLLKLLKSIYPSCNDFGSEIIPSAVKDHNVQAYLFNDYWEDIGNRAVSFMQQPKFEFYDPKTPFFTSRRFLPPTKVDKCRIVNAIVSHGCFLRECSVENSIVGNRSQLKSSVELKDTMMMGADCYQSEYEIASLLVEGKVPIGVGKNTKIRNCIIDKNAKIGRDVIIANSDGAQEADRPNEGFYIRSGITVIQKNATIRDETVV
ncbi:NTP_transferase domain-containing protein, partial [Cephalotus follicularis]